MAKDTTGRLHVTVKTGGKRKLSSKLWLERQLNDPYVRAGQARRLSLARGLQAGRDRRQVSSAQARHDGGRSRRRARRLEPDRRQTRRLGHGKGRVVAIDLLDMPEIAGVDFAQLDFLDNDAPAKLIAMMQRRADVVMSDMAANTTGHRKTDQLRIVGLEQPTKEPSALPVAEGAPSFLSGLCEERACPERRT